MGKITEIIANNDYHGVAQELGYNKLKIENWASSAGDWSFYVSRDGEQWQRMFRKNNFPYVGFTYYIDSEILNLSEELTQ
jgi:hypothetical protein